MSGAIAAVGALTAAQVAAGAAVLGAGASIYQGQKQAGAEKKAAGQAQSNADTAATTQEQEINRANAKSPNTAAIDSGNQQAAAGGPSSTMLTGPGGVDPSTLNLSKNTLLGM